MMTTIFLYRFNIAIQRLTDEGIRNIGIGKLLFIFCCFDNDYTQLNKPMPMLEGMFGWWLKNILPGPERLPRRPILDPWSQDLLPGRPLPARTPTKQPLNASNTQFNCLNDSISRQWYL